MPAYYIDFTTDRGAQRLRFTVDHDRSLGPQLQQVLEEMRQRGVVISGAPGEELGAYWSDRSLDLAQQPAALGISPDQPLVLRMRPRVRETVRVQVAALPVAFFLPRGAYVAPLLGATGALLAWAGLSGVTAVGDVITSYTRLDVMNGALLGCVIGLFVGVGRAIREELDTWAGAAVGALLGSLGGLVGAFAGVALGGALRSLVPSLGFGGERVVTWLCVGAFLGAALAAPLVRRAPGTIESTLWGALAGALAGMVYSFPGPADFWQALSFLLLGAGVGAGVYLGGLRRAVAVLELEGPRSPLRWREWSLHDGHPVPLYGDAESVDPIGSVVCEAERCTVVPAVSGAPLSVSGRPARQVVPLGTEERIEVANQVYRFRRRARA